MNKRLSPENAAFEHLQDIKEKMESLRQTNNFLQVLYDERDKHTDNLKLLESNPIEGPDTVWNYNFNRYFLRLINKEIDNS